MTKSQARLLVIVLSAHRIPFTIRREGSAYIVAFNLDHAETVATAIGA